MRARTIKPGFFKNEQLAELPMAARLLFAGLWCLADREGRLEDRPRRIKAELFPYDDLDVEPLLQALADHGFIVRYSVDGARYIQVTNFTKHQSPHPREAASEIPPPPAHSDDGDDALAAETDWTDPNDATADETLASHGQAWTSREKALPSREKALPSRGKARTSHEKAMTSQAGSSHSNISHSLRPSGSSHSHLLAPDACAPARESRRDDLFETLVEVCYGAPYDQVRLTRSERGRVNAAVKELRAVGATADEVRKRAEAYRRRWPSVDLTPTALAANWAKLDVLPEARASPNGSAAVIDWDAARARRARMLAAIQQILAEQEADDQGGGET